MSATDEMVYELRGLIDEPLEDTYSDDDLKTAIEKYPRNDALGTKPFYYNIGTNPPTRVQNGSWMPTYDLNCAAADMWLKKATKRAQDFAFSADGGSYSRDQAYQQMMQNYRTFMSRRSPSTVLVWPVPKVGTSSLADDTETLDEDFLLEV